MSRVVIIKDEIRPNLHVMEDGLLRAVDIIFNNFAMVAENEMKVGARWHDDTGNARAGLVASADREGNKFILNFASLASYGIWLEVRWSGKYAIVGPVMQSIAPRLAKVIADTALP